MKLSIQTNKILGKDWLHYHPYSKTTSVDNFYIALCNNVLKIIQQSAIAEFIVNPKEEKALACVLVAYFEDVISETRLFSTFTRLHKKMYGKELPFYEISDDYYDDEINLRDIYFLIWYHISIHDEETLFDPYFEHNQSFNKAASEIYNLFEREFEKAPQNENLQDFLRLSAGSDVKTVREKLSFIAYKSFLWKAVFGKYFEKIIDKYKEKGIVVLDEESNVYIYDQQIHFIFNACLPLLTMRANEYYAEILGEEHSEYQFIKNISKRIAGCFLIRKIEKAGFLIEHLSSKKQLWLSNEFTSLQDVELVENETVLTISLVNWKDDVWQNQGGCMVNSINEMQGNDVSEHLLDDENEKKEFLRKFEKAFLEATTGNRIVYVRGSREYAELYLKVVRKHAKIIDPKIKDKELNERYKNFVESIEKNTPFENDEAIGVFFNSNSGIEVYRESVISCMSDKNNPYYANQEFDLCDLIINHTFSKEFINYVIENEIIEYYISEYENLDMLDIAMDNLDFLLRFYRRSRYFSKLEVTIK